MSPVARLHGEAESEIARLRRDRDALLKALKDARPHIGVGYSGIQRHKITAQVDAAIAQAERP